MKLYINNQSGFALPLAIFTVIIVTILTGIMMGALNNEFKTRGATEEIIATKYLAEAGIEHGIAAMVKFIESEMSREDYSAAGQVTIDFAVGLDRYDDEVAMTNNGNTLGFYQYKVGVNTLESLTFSIIQEGTEEEPTFRAVPQQSIILFVVNSKGWRSTDKTYYLEAEIEFNVNYSTRQVEGVRVARWTEEFN